MNKRGRGGLTALVGISISEGWVKGHLLPVLSSFTKTRFSRFLLSAFIVARREISS